MGSATAFQAILRETQQTYLESKFCIVPEGDTPTSRRLFDALAAGCIPIIFGRVDKVSRSLPFSATIDWPSVVLFAGDLWCSSQKHGRIATWLHGLMAKSDEGIIGKMHKHGKAVFRDALSYTRGDGLVDALL